MKNSIKNMPRLCSRSIYFPAIVATFVHISTLAQDIPDTVVGIHVHRSGTTAHLLNSAKSALKGLQAQCQSMNAVCAMGTGKNAEACSKGVGPFKLQGNLADVGTLETDEYFAVDLQMAARQKRQTVLRVKSICELEVDVVETSDIWHYESSRYSHFEHKTNPKKGRHWVRTEHQRLPLKTLSLPAGVLPFTLASSVSPALGKKTYAGHSCEVRVITGPWTGTLCLTATGTSFPGQLTLASKVVAGSETMLEDMATAVAINVVLPGSLFSPTAK